MGCLPAQIVFYLLASVVLLSACGGGGGNGSSADTLAPQISANASGYAAAVWHHSDGTRNNTQANRFE